MSLPASPSSFTLLNLVALLKKSATPSAYLAPDDQSYDEEDDEEDDYPFKFLATASNMQTEMLRAAPMLQEFLTSWASGKSLSLQPPDTSVPQQSDPSLHQLLTSAFPNSPNLVPLVAEDFRCSVASLDSLLTRVQFYQQMLDDGDVDRGGVFGVFARRVILGVEKLSFEGVALFYESTRRYLEKSELSTINNNDNNETNPSIPSLQTSVNQALRSLSKTIGKSSFEEVDIEIQCMLSRHPELPLAHYLRYLNCMHHRELSGAVDSLHRYFDYTITTGGGVLGGSSGIGRGTHGGSAAAAAQYVASEPNGNEECSDD